MYLNNMSANQLQNWICKLSLAIRDNDSNVELYRKWLAEAEQEQLKRVRGFSVVVR